MANEFRRYANFFFNFRTSASGFAVSLPSECAVLRDYFGPVATTFGAAQQFAQLGSWNWRSSNELSIFLQARQYPLCRFLAALAALDTSSLIWIPWMTRPNSALRTQFVQVMNCARPFSLQAMKIIDLKPQIAGISISPMPEAWPFEWPRNLVFSNYFKRIWMGVEPNLIQAWLASNFIFFKSGVAV